VRATTIFNRLLDLPGVWVIGVEFNNDDRSVTIDVRLRRRRLECPHCGWTTVARHNWQPRPSTWRALDLGTWRVLVRCRLRRLACRPCARVTVEAVGFARHGSRHTRDFEDLVAWLVKHVDKTAVTRLCRINWRTTGAIVARVVGDQLDDTRLEDLFDIGVDEVAYRKQHHYLTLIADHDSGTIVWADEGRDAATLTRFFDQLGPARAAQLQAISTDMSAAYLKAIREHDDVDATLCIDPFHVAQLGNKALDVVRRGYWNELRDRAGRDDARRFKHARWALLKRPEDLTDTQQDQLSAIRRVGGQVWRAYRLKEALRAIFDPDLSAAEAARLLDRFVSWAQRSRLPSFITLQRTIRQHRAGILAALELGINNGRTEGLNRKVRALTSRAFGFHSADAVAAMIMLCCGPVELRLPHDERSHQ
jgi:transposase